MILLAVTTLGEYEPIKPPVKSDFNKAQVTRYGQKVLQYIFLKCHE